MERLNEAEEREDSFLRLEDIRQTLRTPHGFALILRLLKDAQIFAPYAEPSEYQLRGIFHQLFKDIEEADPEAALRLFAHCRGIRQCPGLP